MKPLVIPIKHHKITIKSTLKSLGSLKNPMKSLSNPIKSPFSQDFFCDTSRLIPLHNAASLAVSSGSTAARMRARPQGEVVILWRISWEHHLSWWILVDVRCYSHDFFDDVPIESSHQFELKRILNWTIPYKAIVWKHVPLHRSYW